MILSERKVPILVYHRVHSDDDPSMPPVSPDIHCGHVTLSTFRRQMAALADRGFTTVSHEQIGNWLYGQEDLPEGPVAVLDFDDNRLNVFENALPVMKEYGFTGTVFVVSRLADGNLPGFQTYPRMNWDHLGKLLDFGWEIAAHTATHKFAAQLLRGFSGPDGVKRLIEEIVECNEAIERHLGIKTAHFTYPGGDWDQAAEAFIVRYYKTARHWVCDDRPYEYNTYETNPYRLQSINISMHMSEKRFLGLLDNCML